MSDLTQEQKDFIDGVSAKAKDAVAEALKEQGEAFEKKFNDLKDSLEKKNGEVGSENIIKDIEELKSNVAELHKNKSNPMNLNNKSGLENIVDAILDNENFQKLAKSEGISKTGKMEFDLKSIVSLENSYEGNILISQQSNVVVSHPQPRKINMRDVITKTTGDPAYPNITFTKITELDRNVANVSENGRLPQSAYKVKEETSSTKRIGTYIPISKRMLKSRTYMRSWLLNNIPKWVRMAEDFQILNGDGNGENLLGIKREAPDFAKVLSDDLVTGVAGSVKEVASYAGGTQTSIEFANAQPLLNNGMKVTFAGFANGAYNGTFTLNRVSDRVFVIDVPYTSQTPSEVAAVTFKAGSEFAKSVETPNVVDVLFAAQKYLTYGEYVPGVYVLNPMDVFIIQTLKNTLGDKLRTTITVTDGVTYIGSVPVVETSAMNPGEFLVGDFANAAELVDYTSLIVEFAEDVETKLTNQVVLIAQEEVIFPVYNPFAFLKGKFSEVLPLLQA